MALLVLPVCRLVRRGKTKCANVGWQNFKIFCAVGKKIKHRRVGNECRLTRCPNVVSSLCRCSLVKMVYFFSVFSCLFNDVVSVFTLAGNVLQIGDGRAFQHKSLFGELNFRLPQNCQAETKPRLLPMCCYAVVFLYASSYFSLYLIGVIVQII